MRRAAVVARLPAGELLAVLARRGGDPVEHDRHQHDADAGHEGVADVAARSGRCTTGWPRPGPLMKAAMVAIDSAAIVVWLMPTMMVRLAIGSSTLVSRCHGVCPIESVASSVGRGEVLQAVRGDPHHRRQRVDQRADHGGRRADAEQQHQRQQVGERRQRLHHVEDRRDDRPRARLLCAIQTASGSPIATEKATADAA